jgi:2-succinyl-5-enolpyruvyl-6-hydroxy-3-cyclohexene-1-carboxylate synthase
VSVGRSTVDPFATAAIQIPRLPDVSRLKPTDSAWLEAWRNADQACASSEPSPAAALVRVALEAAEPGDLVWYGPSSVIRHAERMAPAFDDVVTSYMNRGTNGIDGVVSAALGAAIAHQRFKHDAFAMALMGDLTFLHDINGLLIEAGSPTPNIAFVVLDSNGGRIFETLEQGAPEYHAVFARVYGTPHNRDIAAIASAYGARAFTVDGEHDLRRALSEARGHDGVSVIVLNVRG